MRQLPAFNKAIRMELASKCAPSKMSCGQVRDEFPWRATRPTHERSQGTRSLSGSQQPMPGALGPASLGTGGVAPSAAGGVGRRPPPVRGGTGGTAASAAAGPCANKTAATQVGAQHRFAQQGTPPKAALRR